MKNMTEISIFNPNYQSLLKLNQFDLADAAGKVPTVKIGRVLPCFQRHHGFMKLESCNPTGSIKDKNASYLIQEAERKGLLSEGGTIIESSSGNFGIALASIGASRGYNVTIVIDAKTPPPMRRTLTALGAKLEEVPLYLADSTGSMQKARMKHARKLADNTPGSFYPCQHLNPDNPAAHYLYTGPEILSSLPFKPDAVVIGMSTCGQLAGIARYIRENSPKTEIIAVDVKGSVILGTPGHSYKMTGLGLSFVPPNFSVDYVDYGYLIPDEISFNMARKLARSEGLFLGASTGAIVAACARYLSRHSDKKRVLMINPDRGDRYLETIYNDDWMNENRFNILNCHQINQRLAEIEPVVYPKCEIHGVSKCG